MPIVSPGLRRLACLAWSCAPALLVSIPAVAPPAPSAWPVRQVAYLEDGLTAVNEPPVLLAITAQPESAVRFEETPAAGIDFVPPLPSAPASAVPRRLPVADHPAGLRDEAPAPATRRLPATGAAAPRVAKQERGALLIDRLGEESRDDVVLAPPRPLQRDAATSDFAPRAPQHDAPPLARRDDPAVRPAMEAVSERARSIAGHGAKLAERGAYYSARSEFIQSLRVVTQALDAQSGDVHHSQALSEGLRALAEADDFAPQGSQLEADLNLAGIIAGHRTPVLKDAEFERLTPLVALQRYYTYAHQRLSAACKDEPAAAEALFGLGRLTTVMAQRSADERRLHAPKAMALYHAALAVNPQHAQAAHELGVLYAQFGQFDDAKRLLVRSATLAPRPETWHNLAVVHERLGEQDLAKKARYEMQLAGGSPRQRQSSSGLAVEWVDAGKFAGEAPRAEVRSASKPQSGNPWMR